MKYSRGARLSVKSFSTGFGLLGVTLTLLLGCETPQADAVDTGEFLKIQTLNNCKPGEVFTYPYLLQSDWQSPYGNDSKIASGIDTLRLKIAKSKTASPIELPSYYKKSGFLAFASLTKFEGRVGAEFESHNFEIFGIKKDEIVLLYEVNKDDGDGNYFRVFYEGEKLTPENLVSGSHWMKKCVALGKPVTYEHPYGQTRWNRARGTQQWTFAGSDFQKAKENNIFALLPAFGKTTAGQQQSALLGEDSLRNSTPEDRFQADDLHPPYPLETGLQPYVNDPLLVKQAWWHDLGEIFERYYYSEGNSTIGWHWLERLNSTNRQHFEILNDASGRRLRWHCYLNDNEPAAQPYVDLVFTDAKAQENWVNAVQRGESLPDSGLSTGNMTFPGRYAQRPGYVSRLFNRGTAAIPKAKRDWYVSCHIGDHGPIHLRSRARANFQLNQGSTQTIFDLPEGLTHPAPTN